MLRSYIELLWVKREKMKVVCVDSCIRSRVFGIDIALRNRFELFEEMKVPYELWVSEAYADIYSDVGARKRVLECYEALGIDRTKVRFLGLELGGRSVQEFAEEELEPADWLIMERLDIPENILLRRGQDFHVARVLHQDHMIALGQELNKKVMGWLDQDVLDCLILVGEGQEAYLPQKMRDTALFIPTTYAEQVVQYQRERVFDSKDIRLVTVSRLSEEKNVLLLLKIMALLKFKGHRQFTLDIYGDGPDMAMLQDVVQLNDLEDMVHFKGYHSQVPYQAYDAYISTSLSEAFATSLYEALVNGLPLIGLDVRYANRAYIKHGENGWLIPQNDANQYVVHLEQFSQFGEKEWRRLSARSKELANRYNRELLVNLWEKVFKMSKIGD